MSICGVKHELSALVPATVPRNINLSSVASSKTGCLLSVWPSRVRERQQEILYMEIVGLMLRGGVKAAFNRFEISFHVGDVAQLEQISVFRRGDSDTTAA